MAMFKHKTIRRFRVGEFEFKNHILVIKDEAKESKFRELFAKLPARDRNGIIEIDEKALAALEKPVGGPKVVKGVADHTGVNKTPSSDGVTRPVADIPAASQQDIQDIVEGSKESESSAEGAEGASDAQSPTLPSLAEMAAGKKKS